MMADLMGDHIGLGKVVRGTELVFHVVVERQIDIDLAISGAIKRTHGRLCRAAGRIHMTARIITIVPMPMSPLRPGHQWEDESRRLSVGNQSLLLLRHRRGGLQHCHSGAPVSTTCFSPWAIV